MYNVMTWYDPILTPDSLWPVWADTDMLENVDILTLAPDSLWPIRAGRGGFIYIGYSRKHCTMVILDSI